MRPSRWIWSMAFRDARRNGSRHALAIASMALGVAALVTIGTFTDGLRQAVLGRAREFLGADLRIRSRHAFTRDDEAWMQRVVEEDLRARVARRVSFASMAYFPATGSARLVQVRALAGDYPFYGELATEPAEAARTFAATGEALVEDTVLHQFRAQVGDALQIGERTYRIGGRLLRVPGEATASAFLGPRVYLPAEALDPELLSRGSRVIYDAYFALPPGTDVEAVEDSLEPEMVARGLEVRTSDDTQENLGRSLRDLQSFLGIVGFVAVLLGATGIASATLMTLREKLRSAAVLRCLGAGPGQVTVVFLVQFLALGVLSGVLGAVVGVSARGVLPALAADFLTVQPETGFYWRAALTGLAVAILATAAFSSLALLPLRRVPAWAALRAVEPAAPGRDRASLAVWALLLGFVLLFAWGQAGRFLRGLAYAGGVLAAMGCLAAAGALLTRAARALAAPRLSYPGRQALANLHRPNNQTVLLLLTVGFGVFLLVGLHWVEAGLLHTFRDVTDPGQPNLVLFDIQDDQRAAVQQRVQELGFPLVESVPVVTMRLASVKGRTVAELRDEENYRDWVLLREYRSTYRGSLDGESEKLVAGEWVGEWRSQPEPVPVSLEEEQAERLEVEIGDELVFDVQGVSIATRIASLREVEWRRARPNFFVVFPEGVLEEAPKIHVMLTHATDAEESARLQRELAAEFPGVSVVDARLLLEELERLLDHASGAVRFLSALSLLSGLLVLWAAVYSSRSRRTEECVLLRTLGASRRQILTILVLEYAVLGFLGALAGVLLALAASGLVVMLVFSGTPAPTLLPAVFAVGAAVLLCVFVGLATSRGVTRAPPAAILRRERLAVAEVSS